MLIAVRRFFLKVDYPHDCWFIGLLQGSTQWRTYRGAGGQGAGGDRPPSLDISVGKFEGGIPYYISFAEKSNNLQD